MFNTKATIPAQYLSKNKKKLYGSYICSGCQDVSNKPKLISFEIAVCNTWLAQFWGEREIVMCIYTFSQFPISDRTLGFGLTSWHPFTAYCKLLQIWRSMSFKKLATRSSTTPCTMPNMCNDPKIHTHRASLYQMCTNGWWSLCNERLLA